MDISELPYFIRAVSTRTFTSDILLQPIFASPANGRVTLPAGLYSVTGLLYISGMSATTGNGQIDLKGTGTAVISASPLIRVVGVDGAAAVAGAATGSTWITTASPASAVTAGTGTAATYELGGLIEVATGGTLVPSFKQVTAAAAVLAINSWICFTPRGAVGAVSYGAWD